MEFDKRFRLRFERQRITFTRERVRFSSGFDTFLLPRLRKSCVRRITFEIYFRLFY